MITFKQQLGKIKTKVKNDVEFWRSRPLKIRIAAGLALLLLFLVSAAATYSASRYNQVVVTPNVNPDASPVASPTPDPFRPLSILLMGYGGGGHQGGKLSDTMILVYIQPKLRTIHLFSIPRDIWVGLPVVDGSDPKYYKINAAYALGSDDKNYRYKPVQYTGPAGGGELAKYAVKQVLGLEIDHFAVINFASFKKAINVLGGVDVKVENTFDDYVYPIDGLGQDPCGKTPEEIAAVTATLSADLAPKEFPCRYEHLHFDRGVSHMDGDTALKFVRSRHSAQDGSDFARAARQRNLLLAVKEKVLAINFLPKLVPFISSLATDFQTDITIDDFQKLIQKQSEYSDYEVISVPLSVDTIFKASHSADRQFILIPKAGEDEWPSVHQWVQEALVNPSAATQSATVSAQVSP